MTNANLMHEKPNVVRKNQKTWTKEVVIYISIYYIYNAGPAGRFSKNIKKIIMTKTVENRKTVVNEQMVKTVKST